MLLMLFCSISALMSFRWLSIMFLVLFFFHFSRNIRNSTRASPTDGLINGLTNRPTNGRTDRPMDGQTNGRTYPLIEMRELILKLMQSMRSCLEKPRIKTKVLGHSLVCSLVCLHRSLIRLLRLAPPCSLCSRCTHSFAHFAHSQACGKVVI